MDQKRQGALGGACLCAVMAAADAFGPPVSRPTGRFSFVFGTAYDVIGPYGPAMVWGGAGLFFFLVFVGLRSARA